MNRFSGLQIVATMLLAGSTPQLCRGDAPRQSLPAGTQTVATATGSSSQYNNYNGVPAVPAVNPAIGTSQPGKATSSRTNPRRAVQLTSASSPVPTTLSRRQSAQPDESPELLPTPGSSNGPGGISGPTSRAGGSPEVLPDLSGAVNLPPGQLEQTDVALPINLATALQLSDARPLIVGAAQAGAWVAEAQLQRAKVLWVPTFNAGTDYIRHDGFGPDFNRGVNTAARPLNQNINFLYSGIGFTQNVAMTDAIFQPLAARQTLDARRWDIQTAKNDALLATANAYFSVHQFRGQYAGAVDVVGRGHKLVERIEFLSQDLVPRIEVDRAKRMLADIEQQAASARQMWRVSSADLTQVLRLDPRVVVVPQEHDHLQITLIEPNRTLDDLIPLGLTNRPELASQRALVRSVAEKIRQEKGRLLMPSLMLSGFQTPNELIQFGAQGIGYGRNMNLWSLRDDLSPQALWQYEGLGYGNMARIKEQRGEQSRALIEQFRIQDSVAGDITRAQARLQSATVRVVQADRSVREALITYEGNYEGLAQTTRFGNVLVQVYRPQEAVVALSNLLVSYNQYFGTVADYNRSQFELFHALGYPAKEVSVLRTPGDVAPVDTSRPGYLPPVGVGPPPSTR
ncbi:MAG TPA: TolC family protein [Pirellulales bacterium]